MQCKRALEGRACTSRACGIKDRFRRQRPSVLELDRLDIRTHGSGLLQQRQPLGPLALPDPQHSQRRQRARQIRSDRQRPLQARDGFRAALEGPAEVAPDPDDQG